jgi:hypothetical protein
MELPEIARAKMVIFSLISSKKTVRSKSSTDCFLLFICPLARKMKNHFKVFFKQNEFNKNGFFCICIIFATWQPRLSTGLRFKQWLITNKIKKLLEPKFL